MRARVAGGGLLRVFFLLASLGLSEGFAAADSRFAAGEAAWQSLCVSCHSGAMLEAPRREALELLPPESIVETLESGIMSTFALPLGRSGIEAVAFYLTGKEVSRARVDMSAHYCQSDKAAASRSDPRPAWTGWSGDGSGRRYAQGEKLLTTESVDDLSLEWAFAFPDASRARSQATLSQNRVFVGSQSGTVYSLDRDSGCIHWEYQAESEVRGALQLDTDSGALYFGDFKANAYALDAERGALRWKVVVHDHPLATITGSVAADDKHVYVPVSSSEVVPASQPSYECCTFRGALIALAKDDGQRVWEYFSTEVPRLRGENSAGARRFGPSGAPIWSSPTVDKRRNAVLVTTGQNYSLPATGTSDALISLDATSGEVNWVTQVTPNDVWNGACSRRGPNCPEEDGPDFDLGASAVLIDRGGENDLVLLGQKSGKTYGVRAQSGELLWTRKVGRGGTMGGVHWGMSSDGERLYVGVSDQPTNNRYAEGESAPGVQALEPETGKVIWRYLTPDLCPEAKTYLCHNGISAAVSSSPGLVYAGSMDGWLRILDGMTGSVLWEFDTARSYSTVNGTEGRGGAIESDGPVVDGGDVFVSSGYDKWGEYPGNVLLKFSLSDSQMEVPN